MGIIGDLFEKAKLYLSNENPLGGSLKPTIQIRERHEQNPVQQPQTNGETPKITIKEIHRRVPNVTGTDSYRSEVEVKNPNLGHGITVKKQRKPDRCPMCATHGKVVANNNGNHRWKCEECDSTFN